MPTTYQVTGELRDVVEVVDVEGGGARLPPRNRFVGSSPEFDDTRRIEVTYTINEKQYTSVVAVAKLNSSLLGEVERTFGVLWIESPGKEGEPIHVNKNTSHFFLLQSLDAELLKRLVNPTTDLQSLQQLLRPETLATLTAASARALLVAEEHRSYVDPIERAEFMLLSFELDPIIISLRSKTSIAPESSKPVALDVQPLSPAEIARRSAEALIAKLASVEVIFDGMEVQRLKLTSNFNLRVLEYLHGAFKDSLGVSHELREASATLEQGSPELSADELMRPWVDAIVDDLMVNLVREVPIISTAERYHAKEALRGVVSFFLIDQWIPAIH